MDSRYDVKGIIIFLTIILMAISCSQSEKQQPEKTAARTPVTIAVARSPLSLPLFIAKNKGYFSDQGIEVKFLELTSGKKCLEAVFAGKADMATVADVPVVLNSFSRNDYVVIASLAYMHNSMKIAARRDSLVYSPADLAGKRVGIVQGTSSQFFLDLLARRIGLAADKMDIIYMEPEEMEQALTEKQIDAVAIWEPHFFNIKKNMGNELTVLRYGYVNRRTFNLAVMKDYAGTEHKAIEKVIRALIMAKKQILENEEGSKKTLAEELGQDAEFIDWVWDDFEVSLSLDQELILILEELARSALLSKNAAETDMPNYLEFIETKFLARVSPENVTVISK